MSENIIKLVIAGEEFKFWSSVEIMRNIDTFDTFSFQAPFGDGSAIKDLIKPLQFKSGQLFIDDELLSTITIVNVTPSLTADNRSISVSGYAKPGVMNDCSVAYSEYPLEFADQTLEQIAAKLAGFYEVGTKFFEQSGIPFEKVKLEIGQSPFNFLIKLAKLRGFLISNTPGGDLLFWGTAKAVSTTLKQGHTPLLSVTPSIDPQGYYSEITGLSPGKLGIEVEFEKVTIKNKNLSAYRPFAFKVDQQLSGADLQRAVRWKMGLMFANSIKYTVSVVGLRDERGDIWKPNTYIDLTAPDVFINRETRFIIQSSTLAKSDSEITVLNLVLPESYSFEIPKRMPWE